MHLFEGDACTYSFGEMSLTVKVTSHIHSLGTFEKYGSKAQKQ